MKKVALFIILALFGALGSLPLFAQYPYGNTTYATPSFVNLNQGAVSFVIGNKAYSGTGNTYNPQEFWEYDAVTNAWTRKADFPGANRLRAVAFSLGNKGYIGTGQLLAGGFAADFWEYDPATNTWTEKASMPEARRSAVGFSIGNKGYVGTGTTAANLYTNDFWEFDPALNTWTQKANFSGIARRGASGFAISNKGYLGTGLGSTGSFKDFWEYDPAGDAWTQKTDFAGTARNAAVGGASSGKGFIGTGTIGATFYGDVYDYNPATNTWASRGGFAQRRDATGFAINGQIYIGLGLTGTSTSYLPDFLRFSPYWEVRNSTGDYDEANGGDCFLYPMQYTGTWRGYLECVADNSGCYAGSAVNTLQNLGNLCYLSRVEANPNFRGGFGWYGGLVQEEVRFCRRNYRITYQNQPVAPVGLQLYYTKAEIDNLINVFNATFGTYKTYSDLVLIKYNGPNQDLDPTNNSTNNSDYQKIIPTLTFYGNANQYVYAEFNVSSYSEYYLAVVGDRKFYVNDGDITGDLYTTGIGSNTNNGSPSAPFATLTHALSLASAGDSIFIDAGTYTEQVTIDKGIVIKGAGKNLTSILKPPTTVAPPGSFSEQGVIQTAQSITGDVHISNLSVTGDYTVNVTPIIIQSGGSVKNCKLQSGNQGIFVRIDPIINLATKTFVVDSNMINAEYIAVNFAGTRLTGTLSNNTLATFNPGFSTGVFAGLNFGALAGLTVTGNTFSSFVSDGLLVSTNNGIISQNSFLGTGPKAINNIGGSTINATCNWYGSPLAATVVSKINGGVTYSPWLIDGTDSNPVIGFQSSATCPVANSYYVNDNSTTGDVFTTAVGNNVNAGTFDAPFATLNHAILQVPIGATIFMDAGLYAEDVIVNKAVVIKGVQAGIDPGSLLTRGTETVLVPGTLDPVNGTVFNIQAGDIVIDGLTIDGDNPSIAGTVTLNGTDINKGIGIARFINNTTAHNNLLFKNNILKNFYRYGVFIQSTNTLPLSGNMISRSHFDNISALVVDGNAGRQGRAVGLSTNGYASITQNIFTKVHTGIWMSTFDAGSPNSFNITGNTIESYRGGINIFGLNGAASPYLIDGNNISTANLATWDVPGADTWNSNIGIGVSNSSSPAGMNISNNTIDNTYEGLAIGRLSGPANYLITGNTISNSTEIGLYYYSSSAVNPSVQIENNTLVSNDTGIYIHYLGGAGGLLPVILSNNSVTGGTLGLQFDGSQVALTGNVLSGSFSGQSGSYIQLIRNALNNQTIDASSLSFGGKTSAVMTLPELFATEDRIAHSIDYAGVGFLKIKPLNVFLTQNSFSSTLPIPWGTATTSADLQRAVGAAVNGDSIRVNTGTYSTTDFTLNKSITISGLNNLISPTDAVNRLLPNAARNGEATIAGATITIGASDITLEGLTFDPGNKSAVLLANTNVTNNDFGNFKFAKNIYRITHTNANLNSFAITGKFVTSPNLPVTSGYAITDNRFEKSGSSNGSTLSFNYVKNILVNDNSFLVTGTAVRTQQAANLGGTGLVDAFSFSNNLVNEALVAVGGNRIAGAAVSGNKIDNTNVAFNNTNSLTQSTNIDINNNSLENTTGGSPFMLYNRTGTSLAGTSNVLKVENNNMTGIPVAGLGGQLFGSMNFTSSNTILNTSVIIKGNKVNYTGDFSLVQSNNNRPISLRGNMASVLIEKNELLLENSGGMLPIPSEAFVVNPGITINTEFFGSNMPANAVINILNNKVQGFKQSVAFFDANNSVNNPYTGYGNIPIGALVNINSNSFTGDSISINSGETGEIINANCNWYGSSSAHNVTPKITETTVDYSPWLTNGTDTDVATGFQPVASSCNGVPVDADIITVTNVTCNAAANGTIDALVEEGVAPFTYAWSKDNVPGFSSTEDLSNLAPGFYKLIVTDVNGSIDSVFATITEPDALTATASGTNVSCFNGSNGTAAVSAGGGTAPYTYLWSTTATTGSLGNLAAGNYSVTVTDANGCTTVASYNVTQPSLLTVAMTGTTASCSGSATATPAGGTAPYSYTWSNGGNTQTIAGVPNGTYTVVVTDANNCTANGTYTVNGNSSINPSTQLVDISCFGGSNGSITVTGAGGTAPHTYSINGGAYQSSNIFTGLTAGTYIVSAKDATGCFDFVTRTLTQPSLLTVVQDSIRIPCFGVNNGRIYVTVNGGSGGKDYSWTGPNGFTSTTQDPNNLFAGTYSLVVTDAKGCTASLLVVLNQRPAVSITEVVTNVGCRGEFTGAINATITGGSGSGFIFSWTGPNGFAATTEDISGLRWGNYTLTVTDTDNGCITSKLVTVSQPAATLGLTTSKTNVNGCASPGTITASASGGTAPYQYSIDGVTYQSSGLFVNLSGGNYIVYAKDANGCIVTKAVAITDNGSDQYEGNNSKNQAKPIALSTVANARIALAADVADWFRFTTAAGGNYLLTFTHPTISYTFNMYPAGNNAPALVPISSSATTKEYALANNTTYYISITGGLSYSCYNLLVAPSVFMGRSMDGNGDEIKGKPITVTMNAMAYPNPHHGSFTLKIASPEEGLALIELFTVSGQVIAAKTVELQKTENNLVPFSGIKAGTIFYRVRIGKEVLTGKVIGIE